MVGGFDFAFSSKGELLRVFSNDGLIVDYVEYDDKAPWPTGADGTVGCFLICQGCITWCSRRAAHCLRLILRRLVSSIH